MRKSLHIFNLSRCSALLAGIFIPWNLCQISLLSQTVSEPPLPDPLAETTGYYPTLSESALLRGPNNMRALGGGALDSEAGPDLQAQIASDLFPYTNPTPNFYQRNPNVFRPLDQTLGFFTPNDALTYEMDRFDNTSITLDANLGVLTRTFSPELAMVKAGPLFFDVLWVGSGVVFSDFNGARRFGGKAENGDGAAAYIDIAVKGLLRLTDTIYLSTVANLIYLPFDNEVALRFGSGRDAGMLTRLNYSETFGAWDVLLYSEFRGRPGLNWYGDGTVNNSDRAGRYFYGFQTSGPANEFYNQNYAIFTNRLGLSATRLVFENQWRFGFLVEHVDFWRTFSFENHANRERAAVSLGYEGSVIPFAPRFTYEIISTNGYNGLWHRMYLDLTGRLTENVHWISRAGYGFTTGNRSEMGSFLWEVGADHTITKNTTHWIRFGESIFDNELASESLSSRFVRWGIDQRLDRKLFVRAFIQYANSETVIPSMQERQRLGTGLTIRYQPLDFTQILATILYENINQTGQIGDIDRWLYRLEVTQQLGMRLTGHLFYQYEDRSATYNSSFTEHVVGLSLRRYF